MGVTPSSSRAPKIPKAKLKVGLDKPCAQCGQPIYFNYRGPIDGICGRCTDRAGASRKRPVRRETRVIRERSGYGKLVAILVVGVLLGALAWHFLVPLLQR